MKSKLFLLSMFILLLLSGVALAAAGDNISWWTIDAGGGTSGNASYSLTGTIGQPDPGPVLMGGNYHLEGGFWGGALSGNTVQELYLPLVIRK
jgi:hypothetical protein